VYHEFMVASVSNVTFLCLLRDSSNSVPFISAISFSFLPADLFDSTVYGFLYGTQRKYFEIKYRLNFAGDGLVRYVIIFSQTMFFPTWPVGPSSRDQTTVAWIRIKLLLSSKDPQTISSNNCSKGTVNPFRITTFHEWSVCQKIRFLINIFTEFFGM